jgi:c-di-GMP-binding flagellar brake protein YcgR
MRFSLPFLGKSQPQKPAPPERKRVDDIQIFARQPITLEFEREEGTSQYASMVLDFQEGEEVLVAAPLQEDGTELPLEPGASVVFHTTQMDGVRTFSSKVRRLGPTADPSFVLSWPAGVSRMNRRDAIRLPAQLPVDITFSGASGGPQVVRGNTQDLSEGGMMMATPMPIPAETLLSIRLHLPVSETHVCGGRVVRSGEIDPAGEEGEEATTSKSGFWIAVEFLNLSDDGRKDLRQYLWELQREILRRPGRM